MDVLFTKVESQIKTLIEQYNQLARSKKQSHFDQTAWVREKAVLLAKQHKAIAKIKALIAQLKSFEQSL